MRNIYARNYQRLPCLVAALLVGFHRVVEGFALSVSRLAPDLPQPLHLSLEIFVLVAVEAVVSQSAHQLRRLLVGRVIVDYLLPLLVRLSEVSSDHI